MPKTVTNDVETLLMLDPTCFAIDESWDLEDMSSNIRRFASHLETFAESLDQRRSILSADENQSKATVPVTPKAKPSTEPVPQPIQGTSGRNRSRRGRSNTNVKSQAYSTRSAEKVVTTSAKKSKKEETTSDGTSDQYEDEIVAYTSKDVIGCYVAKEFDAGTFRGRVESVIKDEGELLYSVTYSDGDQEEMTAEDLSEALMLFANHQRQSIFKDLSKKAWLNSLGLKAEKKKSRQLAQALKTKAPDDVGERIEGIVANVNEEESTTKTISASAQSIADLNDSASKPAAINPSGIDEETAEKECPENESPETPGPKDSMDEASPAVGYGTVDEQANAMQSPGDDETSNGKRRRLNA